MGGKSSKPRRGDDSREDFVKACKVWPSDEDRGHWTAEPGVDRKTSDYISSIIQRWKSVNVPK
ncbi:hypothetical protein Leryth_018665 [Lithospermum erythrorhizon]|nr:hypothetical protein Leryth_018665 [Lithospermum erythrorhizon]